MPAELLKTCIAAREAGQDFPTIYETVIRPHPLRLGSLRSATDGESIWLDVALSTGERLVYESAQNIFRLVR
jgi:hypothetical protein